MTDTLTEITCPHCDGTGDERVRDDGFTFITDCRWCPAGDWQTDDNDDERGHR